MNRTLLRAGMALAFLVAVSCAVFAAGAQETTATQEPLVIRWFGIRGFPGEGTAIPAMLEELVSTKVGFPVTFDKLGGVSDQEMSAAIQMLLAANELPDVYRQFGVNQDFLQQAATSFTRAEFTQYMPEIYKWQTGLMAQSGVEEEATWARFSDPTNGKHWGIPSIWETGWVPSGQMWRKDVLDDLGYEIPTTIAEAEEVFEAYKAVYPNKFALTGRGKTDWQCFDVVFNAYGISGGDRFVRDGKIVEFYATREFREALIVLRRWYEKGFWDTNFLNHNLEWIQNFAAGNYLVTQWTKDWDFADNTGTGYLEGLRNIPGATAVAATHIAADENMKPGQRVWNPFTGGLTIFGKQLESDSEKLHRIMQVMDLTRDREVSLLAGFGIEGVHYEIPEGETAPKALPPVLGMPEAEKNEKYGFGFYWADIQSNIPMSVKFQKLLDTYVLPDNAIYGKNNLNYNFPLVTGPVVDETGEAVQVSTPTSWFQLVVDIMTGVKPIEYYDEWIQSYYDAGGKAWEQHATRLYLK